MNKQLTAKNVILKHVSKHICEEFGLGDDYVITNFRASTHSLTLTSPSHEITVKVTRLASERLNEAIYREMEDIRIAREEEEVKEEGLPEVEEEEAVAPTKKLIKKA